MNIRFMTPKYGDHAQEREREREIERENPSGRDIVAFYSVTHALPALECMERLRVHLGVEIWVV